MLKTQFLGAKIHFFERSPLRSQTCLSFRTLLLVYSKLVGTPCMCHLVTMYLFRTTIRGPKTTLKTRSREEVVGWLMKKMSVFGMSLLSLSSIYGSFPLVWVRQAHFADIASIGCRWRHFGPILFHYWPISLSCSRHKGCWGRNIWLVWAIQDMAPKTRLGIQAL